MDHEIDELLTQKSAILKAINSMMGDLFQIGIDIGYRRKEEELRERYHVDSKV